MPRREPIPRPRRCGEVARYAVDLLQAHGVRSPIFTKTKHLHVAFEHAGRSISLSLPCSPTNPEACKRAFRSRFYKAIGA